VVVVVGVAVVLGWGDLRPSLFSAAEPSRRTGTEGSAWPGSSVGDLGAPLGPLVLPVPNPPSVVASTAPTGRMAPTSARLVRTHIPSASAAASAHGPDGLLTDRE
jgi:hypothetical protein